MPPYRVLWKNVPPLQPKHVSRGREKDLGNADPCLDTVVYEDLEKILEEIDKDVELNEKGDKMQRGFPIDSSSLSNLLAFFLMRKLIFKQNKCVRFPLSGWCDSLWEFLGSKGMLMGRVAIDTAQRSLLIILGRGQAQNQLNYLKISFWTSLVFYFYWSSWQKY